MSKVDYVNYGGSQMLQPPYQAKQVSFYGFVLAASIEAIQTNLCDNRFNKPSGGAVQMEPAAPCCILAFKKLVSLTCDNPPDSEKGWFSEQECAIWVPLIDKKRDRMFWFHPYIFVDSSYALVLGREVYGFPKSFGWFRIPDAPEQAGFFSLETIGLTTFTPKTHAERMELVRVSRGATPSLQPATRVGGRLEFMAEVADQVGHQQSLFDDLKLLVHLVEDMIDRNAPMAFLKQIPDVEPGKACYMSIVETPAHTTEFLGGALLHGNFDVKITPAASHPIVEDLGLAGNTLKPLLSFYIDFNFEIGVGQEIWSA